MEAETYVHRIGRTARAGADGEAISFCGKEENELLKSIEKLLKKPIPVQDTPDLPKVENNIRQNDVSNKNRPPQKRFSRKQNSSNSTFSKSRPKNRSRNRN